MNQKLLSELRNLGFSEKESRVYVASLQIGSAPMQKIAASAGVNRATTYVLVESLMHR
ncbi:MAG: helix-turn-helix domain-containing protein, partial [Candidatus Paceibacteria bacterium]